MGLASISCNSPPVSRKLDPLSWGRFVLLNKLESGFLLFQTEQGLVAVEPSFWQRVYLLWTFRNFRQLSLPLLNERQTTLINSLFREQGTVVSDEYEPSLKIGVVERFVPPAIDIVAALEIGVVENFGPPALEIAAAPAIGATQAAETDASPALEATLPEPTAEQFIAPPDFYVPLPEISIAAEPAMESDVPPAVKWEELAEEGTQIDHAEFAPGNTLGRAFAPAVSRPILSWPVLSWLKPASPKLAPSNPAESAPAASSPKMSRVEIFGFAAAIGALSLCAFFIVAFHRLGAVPGSQAPTSPPQVSSPDSPSSPGPTPVADNPVDREFRPRQSRRRNSRRRQSSRPESRRREFPHRGG